MNPGTDTARSLAILERVAIQFQYQQWLAISVAISEANDVYVNYLGDLEKRHTSRHASGQHHQKIGKRYVKWTGGPTGHCKPMKECKVRPMEVLQRESIAVWGWTIAQLPSVLPFCPDACGMVVDATGFPDAWTLGLEVWNRATHRELRRFRDSGVDPRPNPNHQDRLHSYS